VKGVIEDHHVGAAGHDSRDLDGVLHGLSARGEQHGAFRVCARGECVEALGHVDIAVVLGHQKAGVGEAGDLLLHPRHNVGSAGADAGDGDAGGQVDEVVAVDVDDDATAGPCHEDRHSRAEAAGQSFVAALLQCPRQRAGELGDELAALLRMLQERGCW
jgi:hypothetical protein